MMRAFTLACLLGAGGVLTADAQAATASLSTSNGSGRAVVARWDGQVIEAGEEVRGLRAEAREIIETWRTFAEKRGYRVDLDASQRVVVVSNSDRFRQYTGSATVVERTLEALRPFTSASETPIVVLRAASAADLAMVTKAATALGIAERLHGYVEEGGRSNRRAVDARLSEAITHLSLTVEDPFLSDWMTDGLASVVAESTTGRAMVNGKAVTLKTVQKEVADSVDEGFKVDLHAISGVKPNAKSVKPDEAKAFAMMAFLKKHHSDHLPSIVSDLGRNQTPEGRAKYVEEERTMLRIAGLNVFNEAREALQQGTRYRP